MSNNVGDFKLASTAAGFTLGFGFLVTWNAIKQTKAIRSPLRSAYIFMVWGEIVANLAIAIIAWLFLDGTLGPTPAVLTGILVLWVFEVQLLMQIIINRIAVVCDNHKLIRNIKWGTLLVIGLIEVAVFVIWIPSHLNPPPSPIFVDINKYWDRMSKVLILIVDAGLNYFFIYIVKKRLVNYHGLKKYAPLVSFTARLMVVSIAMDLMLICLMSLSNQVVYVQFHPVAYMVKLNIEMSMAGLITKLARGSVNDRNNEVRIDSSSHNHTSHNHTSHNHPTHNGGASIGLRSGVHSSAIGKPPGRGVSKDMHEDLEGIRTRKDFDIQVEIIPEKGHVNGASGNTSSESVVEGGFDGRKKGMSSSKGGRDSEDELPLAPPEAASGLKAKRMSWK